MLTKGSRFSLSHLNFQCSSVQSNFQGVNAPKFLFPHALYAIPQTCANHLTHIFLIELEIPQLLILFLTNIVLSSFDILASVCHSVMSILPSEDIELIYNNSNTKVRVWVIFMHELRICQKPASSRNTEIHAFSSISGLNEAVEKAPSSFCNVRAQKIWLVSTFSSNVWQHILRWLLGLKIK